MSTSPLPSPITMWSGISVQSDDPEELSAIDRFYRNGYLEEVGAGNPDLASGHRYELLAPDRHRGFGAKYLTAFDLPDEAAAQRCAARADLLSVPSAPPAWQAGADTSWSLLYRYLNETGPALDRPFAIYMVGVDPPPGLDGSGMEEFNEFYTNVHVPEVARRRRCLRASRYELLGELVVPAEGRPSSWPSTRWTKRERQSPGISGVATHGGRKCGESTRHRGASGTACYPRAGRPDSSTRRRHGRPTPRATSSMF